MFPTRNLSTVPSDGLSLVLALSGTDDDLALQAMPIALIIAVKTMSPGKANAEIFRELLQTLQDTDRPAEATASAA